MKKLFISMIMLVLLLPAFVSADMGAPATIAYKAVVINQNGADYYDYDGSYKKIGTFEKDKEVTVYYDIQANGVTYLFACLGKTNDQSNCYYVKSGDLSPKDKLVSPNNEMVTKLSKANEYRVVADEVEVKEGPSAAYKTVGTLKKGTKGKYFYIMSPYIYVEDNGVKGWIDMIGKKVYTKSLGFITVKDISTTCGTIPKDTIITEAWTATNWDGVSILTYKGCEANYTTFKADDIYALRNENNTRKAIKDLELKEIGTGKTTTVAKGELFKVLAQWDGVGGPGGSFYIEYKGVKGWISGQDEMFEVTNETIKEEEKKEEEKQEEQKEEEEKKEEVTPKKNEEEKKESKGIDTMTLVLICVIAALGLGVLILAIILLANKGKKKEVVPAAAPVETLEETPSASEQTEETTQENDNNQDNQ